MSTPSMLLLCAGAAASLAGVWTLAGLSESSALRATPRVVAATAVGLLGEAALYGRAPAELRGELLLPLLFGTASVLALAVGAAKIEAALAEKDGPRVVRRASGIVAGSFFAMAAVGAVSLDLSASSVTHARLGWALMFALVASSLVVFVQRARYAGVGVLALGQRVWLLAVVAGALLAGARLTQSTPAKAAALPAAAPFIAAPSAVAPSSAPEAAVSAAPAPEVAAAPSVSASAAAVAVGKPGELQIEAISVRGMLEADARGGVARRMEKLNACLAEPKNQQPGTLIVKAGIDAAGSVAFSKPTGGDLMSAPIATCIVPVFYKMGFAAPASSSSGFEITLRVVAP
jgi:hypothetical protein